MKSIILCEGSTDYYLLQYYMRVANGWEDKEASKFRIGKEKARTFAKSDNLLTIAATGGCENLVKAGLEGVLDWNKNSNPTRNDELFKKIVIITDHDDDTIESKFLKQIKELFVDYGITSSSELKNNEWTACESSYSTIGFPKFKFEILLLIIPFSEKGALETFLLNSIAAEDSKECDVINDERKFVEETFEKIKKDAHLSSVYETSRQHITKAKFDVYFSIKTPADQYGQRQNILKNVHWERYSELQKTFSKLGSL